MGVPSPVGRRSGVLMALLPLALAFGGIAARGDPVRPIAEARAQHGWVIDHARSRLGFVTRYAGNQVDGRFDRWSADIVFDPANPGAARALVSVDVASARTGTGEMDAALSGKDWFDVAGFPEATFKVAGFRHLAGNGYEAEGTLSLRGVTRPVRLPVSIAITGDDAAVTGSVDLDRSLFGVGQGVWRDGGAVPLSVRVEIALRARRATATPGTTPPDPPPAAVAASAPAVEPADDYRPVPAFRGQTRAPAPAQPSRYRVERIAGGLAHPWSVAFLPDGEMLVTERPGRLRRISRDGGVSAPITGLPAIKVIAGEGLHDVLLDPGFARNRTLYFTYYAPMPNDPKPTLQSWIAWLTLPAGEHERNPFGVERVARARLSEDGTRLTDVHTIGEGGDRRLVLARDGTLFVTAAPPAGGGVPVDMEPQRLGNAYGKVLRIGRDGSLPSDNPFIGRKDVLPSIYAYGLRDMEGAALHPSTGLLWTHENGPRGGDEINIIRPGRNYGFPIIGYGREYSGALINGGRTAAPGLEQPVYFWTPSIAPSGMTFYRGRLFPLWRNSLFVGALAGKRLIRLELKGERVIAEEPLLTDLGKRIRDVREGPDGALYVLTDEDDGELLRIMPARR